jgi:hypothetical protein
MGFYTYLYLREDGTSYYVGKGMGKRAFSSQHWVPVPPKERILIESHASEEEALEAEKLLISYYGRKNNKTGILRNLTDGGDGVSGGIRPPISEETRNKLKGRIPWNKGIVDCFSKDVLQRMSESHKRYVSSEETRRKLREKRQGRKPALGKHWKLPVLSNGKKKPDSVCQAVAESNIRRRKLPWDEIARRIKTNPDLSYRLIAKEFGCGLRAVITIARICGNRRRIRKTPPRAQSSGNPDFLSL